MKNLTNEQKARIFAMYITSATQTGCIIDTEQNKFPVYLTSVDIFDEMVGYAESHDAPEPDHEEIDNIKLMLTPLSEITDEDAIEISKISDRKVEYRIHNRIVEITRYNVIRPLATGVERYSGDTYMGYEPFANFREGFTIGQIDYLRSKGYDCGYGEHESIIQLGLAIDKTTLGTS